MIYELRIYTLKPGAQPEFLRLNRDFGARIRGDDYGVREGSWTTDLGVLNQYVHLWSYADLAERDRLRAALSQNQAWLTEYVVKIRPLMVAQENRIMNAVDGIPFTPPADDGRHLYEMRTYRAHPQYADEWIGLQKAILPTRERYSRIVGMFRTEIGPLNQFTHFWAYRDLNHRAEVRARALDDPDWQAYIAASPSRLAEMQSAILIPTAASKLQ